MMKILPLVVAAAFASTSAHAAEIQHRAGTGSGGAELATPWALPRFQLGYGVLREVRISLQVDVQGTLTIENTLPVATTVSLLAAERLRFDPGIGGNPLSVTAEASAQVALPASDGVADGAGPSARTIPAQFAAFDSFTLTSGLTPFLATPGEPFLDAQLLLDGFLMWSPDVYVRPGLTYRGNVQVIYVYEPHGPTAPTDDDAELLMPLPRTARVDAFDSRERLALV